MQPQEIVNKQLDYYNNRDIDGFVSMYADSIEIYSWDKPEPTMRGLEQLRTAYTKRFEDPLLHAKINNRIELGNKVIDEEHVTSSLNNCSKVIAVYEVNTEKILKVTFIRG